MPDSLRVMVLAGGPDRERSVSLLSGVAVAKALREAGHEVRERSIDPGDLTALDDFQRWPGDVIFPVLHGRWGEGGQLQQILEQRGIPYVGSRSAAAAVCMHKQRTKLVLEQHGLPTPVGRVYQRGEPLPPIEGPVVVKAVDEGSSLGLEICHTTEDAHAAVRRLARDHDELLIERFISGIELTVGLIDAVNGAGPEALPTIHIQPAGQYYDYQSKYVSRETRYRFDVDLPEAVLAQVQELARRAYTVLGVRHLGRVDFLVDEAHRPWLLELNTMPGFTSHSLVPMAARRAGIELPELVDRFVRLAVDDRPVEEPPVAGADQPSGAGRAQRASLALRSRGA